MDTPATCVQTTANGRTWDVVLSNPPDNYISGAMLEQLSAALDRFESDDSLHVMVLQGGPSVFSKGFDISSLKTKPTPRQLRESLILSNALFSRVAKCKKPTVAAIRGACLGGGLELALACHFRLCHERARLGLPEIWIKLVPGLGGVYRLYQLVGKAKALELVTLGDLVTAEEALRLNLVNRVFPKANFAESVHGFVQALLMAESHVLSEAIQLIAACDEFSEQDNLRLGRDAFARLALS